MLSGSVGPHHEQVETVEVGVALVTEKPMRRPDGDGAAAPLLYGNRVDVSRRGWDPPRRIR